MAEIFFTDLLALAKEDGFREVRFSASRGGQYNGPCLFCKEGGHDRFRIQPGQGRYGWFACSVCGQKGNAVDYLMTKRSLSKWEALQAVGWKPDGTGEPALIAPASALDARPTWEVPPERWQQAALAFARECQEALWSDIGGASLAYLRGRGLSEGIIKYAMLGYHSQESWGAAESWGREKDVKLCQGIVIPWRLKDGLWRLTIRDERVSSGAGRYKQVSGGSNGLYLADSLALGRPCTVVTEGEFDALSVAQTCGKRVAVVATGTTQGGHTPHWIGQLARQQQVLIAFDSEEKGDLAASWWLARLENAQRLRPLWKDANQMLQDGADLAAWVEEGSPIPQPALIVSEPVLATPPKLATTTKGDRPQPASQLSAPRPPQVIGAEALLEVVATLIETYHDSPGRVALDLETTGLNPRIHKVISIALGVPGHVTILDMRPYYGLEEAEQARWREAIQALIRLPVVTWVGQNLKFDWQFLKLHFGAALDTVYDTMLAERLLHGAKSSQGHTRFNLLEIAARYEIPVSKEERNWFIDLDTRPPEWAALFPPAQIAYIVQDIEVPYQIALRQEASLAQHFLQNICELESYCLPALAAIEMHGVLVNRERWQHALGLKEARREELANALTATLGQAFQKAREEQTEAYERYQREQQAEEMRLMHTYTANEDARRAHSWDAFRAQGLLTWHKTHHEPVKPSNAAHTLNLSSSAQLKQALGHLGIHVASTKEEALEEYASNPVIQQLLAWRKLDHFCSAFGESVLKHIEADGRIHAHFAQLGAVSGRIICSEPNLQQIPKKREHEPDEEDIRRCFIAPPGHVLIKSDLSNIELRILAEVSQDETMLRFFAEGRDLHEETARLMFRLAPEVDTRQHLYQGVTVREIAKQINYGLSYGMGAQRLANQLAIAVEEARQLMQTYTQTYPGVTRWLREAAKHAQQKGYSTSIAGRKRFFSFGDDGQGERATMARNHPIQATNADILKRAMWYLYEVLPAGVHVVLVVHDEIVLECPDVLVEEAKEMLQAVLMEACRIDLKRVHLPEAEVLIAPYWKKG